MKNKIWFTPRLAFVLAVLITAGCATSSSGISTPAQIVNTEVPAVSPTVAPTSTPIPDLDLSDARILLDELPTGFEEIPMDDVDIKEAMSSEDGFRPEVLFAYLNPEQFQMIFGMNFLLTNSADRIGFKLALNQPEFTLKQFAGAMGSENIHDEKLLEDMEDFGDARIAMTMLSNVEDMPMRVNVAMFQRDMVGGMIMSMTMEGQSENISLQELGKLFDQHIQDSLNTIE